MASENSDGRRWEETRAIDEQRQEELDREREQHLAEGDREGRLVDELMWGFEDEIHKDLGWIGDEYDEVR